MRGFNRTVITVACATLVVAACWLVLDLTVMSNAAAQSGPPAATQTMKKSDFFDEISRSRIEAILAEPVPEIKIQQQPLREVIAELRRLTGIHMYFHPEELGDVIDPDVPTTVDVDENSVTFNTLLRDLILAPHDLDYVIRKNSLVIMSYDRRLGSPDAAQLVIYNCRDLLVGIPVQPASAGSGNASSSISVESPDEETAAPGDTGAPTSLPAKKTENLHQFGMGGGGFGGGFGGGGVAAVPVQETYSDIGAREQQLADLIRMTIGHEDYPWDDGSNPNYVYGGTIQAFNGMLIVRTLPEIHEKVRQLLRVLRESTKEQAWPADLGDWPHRKKISPPAVPLEEKEIPPGGGGNFF